jgi:hypothetical protein
MLSDFVPAEAQREAVPCHHIPFGPKGETLDQLEGDQPATEEALRNWLRAAIDRLEKERAAAPAKTA